VRVHVGITYMLLAERLRVAFAVVAEHVGRIESDRKLSGGERRVRDGL